MTTALNRLAQSAAPPPGTILVLACGNDLRGDDALGAQFVAAIEEAKERLPRSWQAAITTHWQLQWWPETALLFANRELIVLIDAVCVCANPGVASDTPASSPVAVQRLTPSASQPSELLASVGTHRVSPQALLASAQLLMVPLPPTIWLVALAGENFSLGAPLSPLAKEALAQGVGWFWQMVCNRFGAQERTRTSTPCGSGT